MFGVADLDGNGSLSKEELKACYTLLDFDALPEEELDKVQPHWLIPRAVKDSGSR